MKYELGMFFLTTFLQIQFLFNQFYKKHFFLIFIYSFPLIITMLFQIKAKILYEQNEVHHFSFHKLNKFAFYPP